MSRAVKLVLVGTVAAVLTGCLLPRIPDPVHTYLLGVEPWAWEMLPTAASQTTDGVLLVSPPEAEPGFDTPRIAYLKRPYEVSYYATNRWADVPARMIMPLLIRSLERSGQWRAVVALPSALGGDNRLEADGLVLQQEFLQQPSQVRLALRVQLIKLPEGRLLGARRFEVVEQAPSEDAYGGVTAAGRAVTKLLDQIASWARDCLRKADGRHP